MRKNIFKYCFKSIKLNREKKYNMVLVDDSQQDMYIYIYNGILRLI